MSVSSAEDLLLSDSPQDAKLIALILKSMGVVDFEPAVVVQLLEFTHSCVLAARFSLSNSSASVAPVAP